MHQVISPANKCLDSQCFGVWYGKCTMRRTYPCIEVEYVEVSRHHVQVHLLPAHLWLMPDDQQRAAGKSDDLARAGPWPGRALQCSFVAPVLMCDVA